jgi:hypothetical protein
LQEIGKSTNASQVKLGKYCQLLVRTLRSACIKIPDMVDALFRDNLHHPAFVEG